MNSSSIMCNRDHIHALSVINAIPAYDSELFLNLWGKASRSCTRF